MGALYVKDDEARAMAEELAARRGLTKIAAVKLALANELGRDKPRRTVSDLAAEFRRTSRFTYDPAVVIDKAFWDSLYEDGE